MLVNRGDNLIFFLKTYFYIEVHNMLRHLMSAFGTLSLTIVATDISVGTKQISDLI